MKYEYMIGNGKYFLDNLERLNKNGLEGWELVSIYKPNGREYPTFYFKRLINNTTE